MFYYEASIRSVGGSGKQENCNHSHKSPASVSSVQNLLSIELMAHEWKANRLDMSPLLAAEDIGNLALVDAELLCQSRLTAPSQGGSAFANCDDILGRKFSVIALFSANSWRLVSFLCYRILLIGLIGSKEKMVGAHAGRIVALVADLHAFRDGTIDEFPRNTMCSTGRRFATAFDFHHAIAIADGTPLPYPTISARINFPPKAGSEWGDCFGDRFIASLAAIFATGMRGWSELAIAN